MKDERIWAEYGREERRRGRDGVSYIDNLESLPFSTLSHRTAQRIPAPRHFLLLFYQRLQAQRLTVGVLL